MRWAIRDQTPVSDIDSDRVLLVNFEVFSIYPYILTASGLQMIDVIAVRICICSRWLSFSRYLAITCLHAFLTLISCSLFNIVMHASHHAYSYSIWRCMVVSLLQKEQ